MAAECEEEEEEEEEAAAAAEEDAAVDADRSDDPLVFDAFVVAADTRW